MGYSAYQIYQMLASGNSSAMMQAGDAAYGQAPAMDDVNVQVKNLTQQMNSAWQGNASDLATAGAGPLGGAAQSANEALTSHTNACYSQASALDTAKASVTPIDASAPQNNLLNQAESVFVETDLDKQIAQYQTDSNHNVQVYNSYNNVTSENISQMPSSYGEIPVTNTNISVVNPSMGDPGGAGYRYAGSSVNVSAGGSGTGTSGYAGTGAGTGGSSGTYRAPGGGTVTSGSGAGPVGGGSSWNDPINTTTSSAGSTNEPIVGGVGGYPEDDPALSGAKGFVSNEGAFGGGVGGGLPGEGALGGGAAGGASGSGASGSGGSASGGAGAEGQSSSSSTGQGARSGIGSNAAENAAARGAAGLPGEEGGMGGGGVGGRRGEGDEDKEHKTAEYLQEPDPDSFWGVDTPTVPPVLGL